MSDCEVAAMERMMEQEQEYPIIPCVQCGYCCTVGPCAFGKWDYEKDRCIYLTEDMKCEIYYDIIKDPMAKYNPAFGAGCPSSSFNDVRDAKIKELENEKGNNQKKKKEQDNSKEKDE